MTTKEMIAVMQAYDEGKQIQERKNLINVFDTDIEWKDCKSVIWNWALFDYRIKPEEQEIKYRPFTYEEAYKNFGKIILSNANGKTGIISRMITSITVIGKNDVYINGETAEYCVKNYHFEDKTPCGIPCNTKHQDGNNSCKQCKHNLEPIGDETCCTCMNHDKFESL